jgi:hypothetical protein
VAQGAAVYARYLQNKESGEAGFRVQNVNSHTLGVLGIEPSTMMRRRKVMIARNTPLPAEHTQRFMTAEAGQKSVVVTVVEGGDDSGNHSTLIGRCVLAGLDPNLPPRSQVDVTFHYAEDGCLSVRAFMPAVEREATLSIERAKGMSADMLAAWANCIAGGMADGCELPEVKAAEAGATTTAANPLHAPELRRVQKQVDIVAEDSPGVKEKTFVLGDEAESSPTVMADPPKKTAAAAPAAKAEPPKSKPVMKPEPPAKADEETRRQTGRGHRSAARAGRTGRVAAKHPRRARRFFRRYGSQEEEKEEARRPRRPGCRQGQEKAGLEVLVVRSRPASDSQLRFASCVSRPAAGSCSRFVCSLHRSMRPAALRKSSCRRSPTFRPTAVRSSSRGAATCGRRRPPAVAFAD